MVGRRWTIEEEEIVCRTYLNHRKDYRKHVDEILKQLCDKGYSDRDKLKVLAKLNDYNRIAQDKLDSNIAPKSIEVYQRLSSARSKLFEGLNGYFADLYGRDVPIFDYDTEVNLISDGGIVDISFDSTTNNFIVPGLNVQPQRGNAFVNKLFELLNKDGRTGRDLYGDHEEYIDRRYLSRMQQGMCLTKGNILRVAIMLRLNLSATEELLGLAGFALSKGIKKDIIIIYAIEHKIYDCGEIDRTLADYNEEILFKA